MTKQQLKSIMVVIILFVVCGVIVYILISPKSSTNNYTDKNDFPNTSDEQLQKTNPAAEPPITITNTPTPVVPTPTPILPPDANTTSVHITYYGFPDNDPPGKDIAYPKNRFSETVHYEAGGVGNYDNPITMAADPNNMIIGQVVYIPYIKKYAVMEDLCATCTNSWQNGKSHIDLWMESDETHTSELFSCQNRWTRNEVIIEIDPPATRPVEFTSIFNKINGECIGG